MKVAQLSGCVAVDAKREKLMAMRGWRCVSLVTLLFDEGRKCIKSGPECYPISSRIHVYTHAWKKKRNSETAKHVIFAESISDEIHWFRRSQPASRRCGETHWQEKLRATRSQRSCSFGPGGLLTAGTARKRDEDRTVSKSTARHVHRCGDAAIPRSSIGRRDGWGGKRRRSERSRQVGLAVRCRPENLGPLTPKCQVFGIARKTDMVRASEYSY